MTNSKFDKNSSVSVVALLSRVLMSAIFIWAGFGKLTAAAGTTAYFTKIGLPMPSLAYLVAVAVELGGGILMLVFSHARRPLFWDCGASRPRLSALRRPQHGNSFHEKPDHGWRLRLCRASRRGRFQPRCSLGQAAGARSGLISLGWRPRRALSARATLVRRASRKASRNAREGFRQRRVTR